MTVTELRRRLEVMERQGLGLRQVDYRWFGPDDMVDHEIISAEHDNNEGKVVIS